jgi:TetR/AcrR family transcriptional regulator
MEEDTKTLIVEKAVSLFARRGFDGAGIQEIAETAGVTKPTLYYHFGSKRGLLEEIVRRYGGPLVEGCENAALYRHDLVMNLRELFQVCLRTAQGYPDFWRFMLNLFASPVDSAGNGPGCELRRSLLRVLEKLFEEAAQDHGNMKGRHKIYAEIFLGILETCGRLSINGPIELDQDLRFRIIHQFMHGIFS